MPNPWDFNNVWVEHSITSPTPGYPTFIGYNPVSGVGKCKYLAAGTVRGLVNTFGGLTHLNGQLVAVQADGIDIGDQVVANNQVQLTTPAGTIHVGLRYAWKLKFLPLGGDGQTVNQTKERKVFDIVLRVFKSLGGKVGKDEAKTFPINYTAIENINRNPDDDVLFTGDLIVGFESSTLNYWTPVIEDDSAYPFQLLAAIIRSEIFEDK